MRIAFLADGRAENFRRWLPYLYRTNDEIMLLSSYPCPKDSARVSTTILPGLFRISNMFVKSSKHIDSRDKNRLGFLMSAGLSSKKLYNIWHQIKMVDVLLQAKAARKALKRFQPDIVQALRIQNEGYIAALANYQPWLLFVWGSDFVYHAKRFWLHGWLTKLTVRKAKGLMADCYRDIRLAREAGLKKNVPVSCFPTNGGVDFQIYKFGVTAGQRLRLVVFPRGLAPYMRLDTLFSAMSLLRKQSQYKVARFILLIQPTLVPVVKQMMEAYNVFAGFVEVIPFLDQNSFAGMLQEAAIVVSPSLTDGSPNCMLEAMACGAFPVMSDLESIREWIDHGTNGLLFDPNDPEALAKCLLEALDSVSLREKAQDINLELVRQRADYAKVMPQVREFYQKIVARSKRRAWK